MEILPMAEGILDKIKLINCGHTYLRTILAETEGHLRFISQGAVTLKSGS